jgi:hypothetical protein
VITRRLPKGKYVVQVYVELVDKHHEEGEADLCFTVFGPFKTIGKAIEWKNNFPPESDELDMFSCNEDTLIPNLAMYYEDWVYPEDFVWVAKPQDPWSGKKWKTRKYKIKEVNR